MIDIILYEPEIPPNTGNIIRLCANSSVNLHLIEPLGFDLNEKSLRRAGLDYHKLTNVKRYANFSLFYKEHSDRKIWLCTTKAKNYYHQVKFKKDDMLLFGSETKGVPEDIMDLYKDTQIKIPMHSNSRSINLSNSVAIILYKALVDIDFACIDL